MKNEEIEKKLEEIFLECKVYKDGRRYHKKLGTYAHIVWNLYNPKNQIKRGDKNLVHHKDGNPGNEKIENLQKLTRGKHTILHKEGKHFSEESKKKMSLSRIGKKNVRISKRT
jgi:predicted HicB family RNase H-like nuclease